MDIQIIGWIVVGLALVLLASVAIARYVDPPPDDPWMLEHGHRLSHHYRPGMTRMDYDLQREGQERRKARDREVGRVQVTHSERPRLRRVRGAG